MGTLIVSWLCVRNELTDFDILTNHMFCMQISRSYLQHLDFEILISRKCSATPWMNLQNAHFDLFSSGDASYVISLIFLFGYLYLLMYLHTHRYGYINIIIISIFLFKHFFLCSFPTSPLSRCPHNYHGSWVSFVIRRVAGPIPREWRVNKSDKHRT